MGPNLYVIDATMPPGTTKEQYRAMLQNLLAERFHLAVHHETRNFPGYELAVAKGGPKLKESTPDSKAADDAKPQGPPGMGKDGFPNLPGSGPRSVGMDGSGTHRQKYLEESMERFAASLGFAVSQALGAALGSPTPRVVDQTGLTGKYDFIVEYSCAGCRGIRDLAPMLAAQHQGDAPSAASDPSGSNLPGIFAALEEQLGLKLEKVRDVPVDGIVVDRVDKIPTAN
jgi:uncharacterized protein (TIGR03435 family)